MIGLNIILLGYWIIILEGLVKQSYTTMRLHHVKNNSFCYIHENLVEQGPDASGYAIIKKQLRLMLAIIFHKDRQTSDFKVI